MAFFSFFTEQVGGISLYCAVPVGIIPIQNEPSIKLMRRSGKTKEIESIDELKGTEGDLTNCVLQGLELKKAKLKWATVTLEDTYFLGCKFPSDKVELDLRQRGAHIFPAFPDLPYNPYRHDLYTWQELMDGYKESDDQSVDKKIYDHFQERREVGPSIIEALSQRIHDHAIDNALKDELEGRQAVAIMGGHKTARGDTYYRKVADIARRLTREGYYVVSGGGPGIMEAANLGAWMSPHSSDDLDAAIAILEEAPMYDDLKYRDKALKVLKKFPSGTDSMAIPTWFYGHEPSNLFATKIGKYFANSIREDGLLAIATYGVIFAPGSGGTMQEIFQDACQNFYGTFGYYSPMVLLGVKKYTEETATFALLMNMSRRKEFSKLLHLTDSASEAASFIFRNPPIPV